MKLHVSAEQVFDDFLHDGLAAVTKVDFIGFPFNEFALIIAEAGCEVSTPGRQDVFVGENLSVFKDNLDIT